MTDRRAATGQSAEVVVAAFFERAGFVVEARNWRCRVGELYVVARSGDLLVIVEVRSVTTRHLASPTLTVDAEKQAKVARAADVYLRQRRGEPPRDVRFDVVGVTFLPDDTRVEHHPNAFVPPWSF